MLKDQLTKISNGAPRKQNIDPEPSTLTITQPTERQTGQGKIQDKRETKWKEEREWERRGPGLLIH